MVSCIEQHGMFGALLIEPTGSVFFNPKNGKLLKSGVNAVIQKANEVLRLFSPLLISVSNSVITPFIFTVTCGIIKI